MKGYKFIQSNMKSQNGNHKWEIGKWYKEDKIELCKKGFHACKEPIEALEYIYGARFFIVEARGEIKEEKGNKFVTSEMRLVKELDVNWIFKRFAIKCAKQCLKHYEKEHPNDKRVHEAIEGAELYLNGKISLKELNKRISAVESAVGSAAESAAESATWSAAWLAWSAVGSAAESAAESATWSAAWLAWSAAESATWSAAESATWSVWSARSAAWLAESAARKEQNKFLKQLIKESLELE